jgi:hypothetical protein
VLTPESLLDDIEVQKPEKSTPKPMSEGGRDFVFYDE